MPERVRWVLLRGLTREAAHFGSFPAELGRALGNDPIIVTPDLPGNGTRWREASPTTIAEMARKVRDEVGPGPPVVPVGLSMGGMVAMEWSRGWPGDGAGLVVINTSAAGISPLTDRLRPRAFATMVSGLLTSNATRREQQILRLTSRVHGQDPDVLQDWIEIQRRRPVARGNAARQVAAAARYRLDPARPPVPVLVVASTHDAIARPRCSRRLARAWDADYLEHEEAGHDLPLDAPRWLADQIASWWRERSGNPRELTPPAL